METRPLRPVGTIKYVEIYIYATKTDEIKSCKVCNYDIF